MAASLNPSDAEVAIVQMVMAYLYGEQWLNCQWEDFANRVDEDAASFNADFMKAVQRLNNLRLVHEIIKITQLP